MTISRRILAAFAVCLLCAPAVGAERLGRFTLEVRIDGAGRQAARSGVQSRFSTEESLHAVFTLASSGAPETENRLEEAGSNLVAMQKVALKLAQQNTGAPLRQRGAGPARYLTYSATVETVCQPEYRARVRTSADGMVSDIQGQIPFTQTTSADFKASALQLMPLCTAVVVADTSTNTIFVYPPSVAIRGKMLRTENKRTTIDAPNTTVRLNQEAMDWVVRQLQAAPRSGKQRTTLRIPAPAGETGEKVINVEMSWSFEAR